VKAANLLLVLLLATAAYAASVTVTPATVYETTTAWETLDVNNYKGSSIITKVKVDSPTLPITDAENYTGWTTTKTASSAEWKDGSIETNVKDAAFEFKVSAPNVTADSTAAITVSLDAASTILNITILNDASPPAISGVKPSGYAKANNAAQAVSATIKDTETSVASATYTWNNCLGGADTIVTLTKSGDLFSSTADFSTYDEEMKACYKFTAKNAPGETATLTGELIFDGTAPTVTINGPTTFATETTTFLFNASDNLATVLSCEVSLESTSVGAVNVSNGTTGSLTADLSSFTEGSHTWTVTCTDGVGLTASKSQAILLDKLPPTITLDYNAFMPRTIAKAFKATVVDTIGLASVNASFESSSVALTKTGDEYTGSVSSDTLGTKTLTVQAKDDAGHVTTKTVTITVVPNHILTLDLSPSSSTPGETITASGTLTPDGTAAVTKVTVKTPSGDDLVDLVSGAYSTTFTAPSAGTYVITTEYTEGGYTYKAEKTLTVTDSGSPQQQTSYKSGIGAEAWRISGYVKPDEPTSSTDSNAVVPDQPVEQPSAPPQQTYEPLPPEEPREAIMPKGTGVFDLAGTIKWISLLLALALLIAIGTYAYKKHGQKEDGGIDWDAYFKNR